ncbi:MAG: hypothetical protein HC871_00030 [Rhizobiales bacterium]|nr:hypothetical protein [Hyphomicrobiales bacterium]
MNDKNETGGIMTTAGISESERMAKIRELLVGPVIADESARVDQSFDRLNQLLRDQRETISALQTRLQQLEENQQTDMQRLQVRLLGIVEALLADEEELRSRLAENGSLSARLDEIDGSDDA